MTIKWNKVTWYSKAIALILFVALPFIGFYYGFQYGKAMAPAPSIPESGGITTTGGTKGSLPDYYTNTAEWQTDTNNTAGGFSIAYPIDFDVQDNSSPAASPDWTMLNASGTPGIKYFTLIVPRAFEPQTNFVEATLTVGGSQNDIAIAQCLDPGPNAGLTGASSTAKVNGIQFTIFHSSGVGAGNIYDTTSYRTLHAGECYSVEYTAHSSEIGNYPTAYNLKPFDQNKIDSLMQNIIGTFKFI